MTCNNAKIAFTHQKLLPDNAHKELGSTFWVQTRQVNVIMKVTGRGMAPPVRQIGPVRVTLSGEVSKSNGWSFREGEGTERGLKPSTERFDLLIFYIHGL
jgi:hypothetical protein